METQVPIYQRLKEARLALGINQEELEALTNIKRSSISKIENGKMEVPNALVVFYTRTYKVNSEWLLNGVGPMFSNSEQSTFSGNTLKGSNSVQGYGNTTTTHTPDTDCQHQLALALKELEGARNEIVLLKQMIDILSKK